MDRERNRALESSRSFWAHIELDKLRGAGLAPHLRSSPEGSQPDAPRLSAAPASPHSCRNPSPRHASHPSRHRRQSEFDYPATTRQDLVETHFNIEIADPYRWLENDVREDRQVRDWVTAQNVVTDAYLETLPGRDIFKARITAIYDYERFGIPATKGRSEERRVGNECVSTCRSRGSPGH